MEKGSDRSQEINLKLQLIKNELMSALGPKTRPKSSKKELKKSENKSNKKQISDEVKEDSKVGTKNKNSKSKISTKSEKNKTMSNRKKEVDLSQKTSTKKKKKSSPSEENEIETDITTRKWDDGKGRKLEKGVFTLEEEKKVMDAICEYAYSNDLGESELIDLITEKQTKKDSKVWTKISECLPNRSVQSIHNFCHRKFNPYNYKGNWTNEEVENLIQLHKEHGSKWELIGKELERTATNVKDKFRQIGGKNFKSRVKEFNLVLCLKMLKYIQEYLNENEKNPELQILKYSYKFKNNLEEQYKNVFHIFEDNYKCLIDSSIKETPSRIIIRNILKLIVDTEVLEKILEENCEISWNSIAEKFSIYSATDCKNNWDKILREFDLWEKGQLRKDLKMIRSLLKCQYDSLDEVNYSIIKNKRSPEENKVKLEEIVRLNDIYSVKSLPEILEKVQDSLEQRLHYVKNEDREFEEEIKKNKPLDIGKIYNNFLSSKRHRGRD